MFNNENIDNSNHSNVSRLMIQDIDYIEEEDQIIDQTNSFEDDSFIEDDECKLRTIRGFISMTK
jgi:hypothetical protein